jgi:hypothetical protein
MGAPPREGCLVVPLSPVSRLPEKELANGRLFGDYHRTLFHAAAFSEKVGKKFPPRWQLRGSAARFRCTGLRVELVQPPIGHLEAGQQIRRAALYAVQDYLSYGYHSILLEVALHLPEG